MVEKETAYNVIQQEFTTIKDFRVLKNNLAQASRNDSGIR
jgi:hypothetical protein